MAQFTVRWEIQIDADTPLEAAQRALAIHRDPDSTATFFEVVRDSTKATTYHDIERKSL